MEVTEERDHFQAQYERMLAQEDSRLNKLVSVYMQVEPLVQDLAIQTEFVAPPMNLRTMVASKNARGKKAPLIFSQSLEVPPSDPGALTSTMVDSASSTYNPLSNHIAAVITARTPQGFPFAQSPDLNSSTTGGVSHLNSLSGSAGGVGASLYHTNTLSARSNMSVESRLGGTQFPSSPTLRQRHALSREDSRQSREDSFFLNAADFLAAAPINYELSSRNLMPADSIQEISRLLAPDDASMTSSRSHQNLRVGNTSHASQTSHTSHTGKIHRKKALKLARLTNASADPHAGSSGQYHHVHNEDKIPEWGSIHATGPVKSANIDPHVVLGISGVSNLVGQSKPSLSDSRNSAFAGHNIASGAVSSQGSNAAVRTNNRNVSTKNSSSELEVGLPEVKVQAYHIPTSQPYANPNNYNVNPQHASNFRAVSLQNANAPNFSDSAYFGSNPTSRGSHNSFGLGSTSPSEKEYMRQSEQMYLMLDSPSLGGQSGYPNFDFEKDRKDPLLIAGDLPSSQESVKGIIYNNRNPNNDQFRLEEPQGQDFSKNAASPASVGQSSVPSAHGSQVSTAASTKANTQANSGKQVSGARGANPKNNPNIGTNNPGGTHNAVGNMNEDVLKRLRKELLSR
uniref:Uncharacterized protein n=1 Tax=Spumella elongata TaxID=89044 RepID=A0A7S3H9C9_9STRA